MRKAIPDGQMKVGLKIQLLFLVGTKSFMLILIFEGRFKLHTFLNGIIINKISSEQSVLFVCPRAKH